MWLPTGRGGSVRHGLTHCYGTPRPIQDSSSTDVDPRALMRRLHWEAGTAAVKVSRKWRSGNGHAGILGWSGFEVWLCRASVNLAPRETGAFAYGIA